ncbi:MAG TPA: hypothetical protein VFX79_00645 [Candidatus Saccharimonadales bacterium]|nr:hypothetical protein [Candidatus Saccharimonadales bacterium]
MTETGAEVFYVQEKFEKGEQQMRNPLAETDLGPENQGAIGPTVSGDQERSLIKETGQPEYHKPPTNVFICVDGRIFLLAPEAEHGQAHPQTAGGITTTVSSANMMTEDDPAPLSEQTKGAVIKATKSGLLVVEHGDEAAEEGGCGARAMQRNTFGFVSEKPEIIVPTVMTIAELTGLTDLRLSANGANKPIIGQKDLLKILEQAGTVAGHDESWDVSPAEQVEISRRNGGQYVICQGLHLEGLAVATTAEGQVFDNQQYSRDHKHPETNEPIQAFAAAFGELKKAIFRIEDQNGGSELTAAKKTLGAFAFNIGTFKMLKNDRLKTVVY